MFKNMLQHAVWLVLAAGALVASIALLGRVTGEPGYADWLVVVAQVLVVVPAVVIAVELGVFLRPLCITFLRPLLRRTLYGPVESDSTRRGLI